MRRDVVPGDCRGGAPRETDGCRGRRRRTVLALYLAPTLPLTGRTWSPAAAPFASLSLEEIAARAGLRTIHVVAWRDYTDPEAGGSELHAHRILSAWSSAGIDVVMTTSSVTGRPALHGPGRLPDHPAGRVATRSSPGR